MNSYVYAYSLPDLEYLGGVHVGSHPDWLTFSPDSKYVYVANAGSNSTSVVSVETLEEVTQIPVGQVPKRVITAVIPAATVTAWSTADAGSSPSVGREALDYKFYRDQVEPIIVNKRGGLARCVVCHATRTALGFRPRHRKVPPGMPSSPDATSKLHDGWSCPATHWAVGSCNYHSRRLLAAIHSTREANTGPRRRTPNGRRSRAGSAGAATKEIVAGNGRSLEFLLQL